jgi:hypothetical protein
MKLVRAPRHAGLSLGVGGLVLCAVLVGASSAATPTPQKTVKGSPITRRPHTLPPGTTVSSGKLGQRVFTDASHGFALVGVGQAQYPAATVDGGKTWKTDGPALHINAAQAPLSVTSLGAANRRTIFAYGNGQVIDTTSNGGKKWYGALFNGLVMAVVPGAQGHLVAFIDASTSNTSNVGVTWQYVSRNGGKTWTYNTSVGG